MHSVATAADPQPHSREALRVAVIAPDRGLRTRIGATLASAGIEVALASEQLGSLSDADQLDAIVLHAGGDEKAQLAAANVARTEFPDVPIVMLWGTTRPGDERRALRLGVDGVVLTAELEGALVQTLHAVKAGLVCVPRVLRGDVSRENLSAREKQILGMLVMGFTNAQIAQRLYLAESTVKSHLSSAYEKLGVRSRKDAAALILDPTVGLDRGILSISAA
jgi:DNA-binding NarL/FixJ family response regulator